MFTFGADPEIFVKKNGVPVSAHGLVSGTKQSPLATATGAVQVDGMALEFNINPSPARDFDLFNLNIVTTIRDLRQMVPGYSFNLSPVQEFSEEYLAAQPDEAKELGCDPDFNAYTGLANPRPDGTRNFRTGAGHVHIGWGADIPIENAEHFEICSSFVKMLDVTVGFFMTYIDRDPRRRELYGSAGAFRPKSYGVEYRTPSNVWLTNKDRRRMMWSMMNLAITAKRNGFSAEKATGLTEQQIVDIINNGDYETACHILDTKFCLYGLTWIEIKKSMFAK